MEARYNPKNIEEKLFAFWKENNLFVPSKEDKDKPSYSVLMPPPNVTNVLHLGHALNNTLQDVMLRYYRMKGYAAIWKIGVDHAGIATQNVVERDLVTEGKTREELGKEEFIKRVWKWKEKYGSNILNQLQRLGVSGDWEHDRFTMDEVSSKAVKEIFVKLYNDGLVYRGEYVINWCPHCLTTISDDEVEYVEYQGSLYYVRYKMEDGETLIVATTRPETILGDVALAVNPEDTRYSKLIGKRVKVPTLDRWIPIIADKSIEIEFGTGILKVTPSHDVVDFAIGKANHLEFIEVLDKYGKTTSIAGEHTGVDRFEYRKIFVQLLKTQDLIEEIKSHNHSRGTCYRCHTVIEPRVSTQWFVRMKSLAQPATKALLDKKIKFTPEKWEKVYYHWMNNIRDWSISRQLWWGHSIPAYHCKDCANIIVTVDIPEVCEQCSSKNISPDPDVLDTWFSSWIWPFTVFDAHEYTKQDWQTTEFKRYYPTQYLATAPEIIFFWVARMIMAGIYLTKEVPFQEVFFNSTICDLQGRKMSKSLGNGIDPIDIIEEHGADALRFTLLFISPKGERIRVERKSFDIGARLITKLWNASRFIFSHKPMSLNTVNANIVEPKDIWESFILSRYKQTLEECEKAIQVFDYYTYSHSIYHFFWSDFCDWFLETQKITLQSDDINEQQRAYLFLEFILDGILRLFHPIMPFITEEIWQNLARKTGIALMKKDFTLNIQILNISFKAVEQAQEIQSFISDLRSLKKEFNMSDKDILSIYINPQDEACQVILTQAKVLEHLANVIILNEQNRDRTYVLVPIFSTSIFLELPVGIDLETEKKRMISNIQALDSEIKRAEGKLANKEFIKNANPELIIKEEDKLLEFKNKKTKLDGFLESLGERNV